MSNIEFYLGVDSSTALQIFPEWDAEFGVEKIEKKHRLQNGDLYVYKFGDYITKEFDLQYVPYSDAQLMNYWWENNTELTIFEVFSGTCVATDILITNTNRPFMNFQMPYTDLMEGKIKLEGYD